jgi:hypothetical protein
LADKTTDVNKACIQEANTFRGSKPAPEYTLLIRHKAIACLYLAAFSADNHARILSTIRD